MEVPLLSNYKTGFIVRRVIQTILGGPRLFLTFKAPIYIYCIQLFLYILPWILGGIFTVLVDHEVLSSQVAMFICGSLMFVTVFAIQATNAYMQHKLSSVSNVDKKNYLQEDDEIEFTSCFGLETYQFLFPSKRHIVTTLVHAVVSAFMCAVAVDYLRFLEMSNWWKSRSVAIILFMFGWMSVCNAQYSLTANGPPETAIFSTNNNQMLGPLFRPFYVCLFLLMHVITWKDERWKDTDACLKCVLPFLPLMWTFGVLPPLDGLIMWMGEQLLTQGCGGSHMASARGLLAILILSIIEVIIVYFLKSWEAIVLFASSFGFLLSTDLGSLVVWVKHNLPKKCQDQMGLLCSSPVRNENSLRKWKLLTDVAHLCLLVALALIAVCPHIINICESIISKIWKHMGYVFLVLFILQKILSNSQSIYTFGGVFRNKLFPADINDLEKFQKKKKKLVGFRILRSLLLKLCVPLLMVFYLSVLGYQNWINRSEKLVFSFAVVRAFRVIWQHTENGLFELTIVHLVYQSLRPSMPSNIPILIVFLLAGMVRDRLYRFWHQMYLVLVLMVTSVSQPKQRLKYGWLLLCLEILLLPVVLSISLTASFLAAPIVPLFTVPVFLVGFPRPLRFWPEKVGKSANYCQDSVFYQQLILPLTTSLQQSLSAGSLGNITPGDYYLARFQDRLIWLQILERGFGYCKLSVKGLELQETSCHAVEASQIDAIFEQMYSAGEGLGKQYSHLNRNIFNTLIPCDSILVRTYSDARNVLTGIIDAPETLKLIVTFFPKVLTWILLHYLISKLSREHSASTVFPNEKSDNYLASVPKRPSSSQSRIIAMKMTELQPVHKVVEQNIEQVNDWAEEEEEKQNDSNDEALWAEAVASYPMKLFWSDDEDPLGESPPRKSNMVKESKECDSTPKFEGSHVYKRNSDGSIPGLLDDDFHRIIELGAPTKGSIKSHIVSARRQAWTPDKLEVESDAAFFTPQYRFPSSSRLGPPKEWLSCPVSKELTSSMKDFFSIEWFQAILEMLLEKHENLKNLYSDDAVKDSGLLEVYQHIVLACHHGVNLASTSKKSATDLGPSHVHSVFHSSLPVTSAQEWLKKTEDLFNLVIKAYRYSVKLAIDQALLGPIFTEEELQEYLEDYDSNWYIGDDNSNDWTKAILLECSYLFSLGINTDQNTYTSHLLTLQSLPIHLGQLNLAAVEGVWSTLILEMLYFTNDDEERYSIQAHPTILRNITIQAADPPLGYPIFSSPPLTIPLLY
ncbi:pecanex-like protein 4 isoform X1 [Tachypleus tridentatus]|uniref:pecanex-like protein 4 isoform X1 n=1 Tax=Tachypleus tridentatus TaxID=6853 RepID=UPI003FD04088